MPAKLTKNSSSIHPVPIHPSSIHQSSLFQCGAGWKPAADWQSANSHLFENSRHPKPLIRHDRIPRSSPPTHPCNWPAPVHHLASSWQPATKPQLSTGDHGRPGFPGHGSPSGRRPRGPYLPANTRNRLAGGRIHPVSAPDRIRSSPIRGDAESCPYSGDPLPACLRLHAFAEAIYRLRGESDAGNDRPALLAGGKL